MANATYPCRGVFFRFTENTYLSQHGSIESRCSLRMLKTMSCDGCPECDPSSLHEEIEEWIENTDMPSIFQELEDGGIYELSIKWIHATPPYFDDGDCELSFKKADQ